MAIAYSSRIDPFTTLRYVKINEVCPCGKIMHHATLNVKVRLYYRIYIYGARMANLNFWSFALTFYALPNSIRLKGLHLRYIFCLYVYKNI